MSGDTIAVIGAGVMGTGVAQDLAQHGLRAILVDLNETILEAARKAIRHNLRAQKLLSKAGAAEPMDAVLARIAYATDYDRLAEAAFVIENVTEDMALKRTVYERLEASSRPDCVFIANTSCIPITRIGSWAKRPSQTVGVHFMNPVPLKTAVEVIRGYHTSDATLEATRALMDRLGKTCIVVNDSPGFVSNRVLMLTINEAVFLLQEGVSDAAGIDAIFRSCFGHKMGPLETADLIGLDTILKSLQVLLECFGDGKFRPCPLLAQMVDAGRLGRKTGAGFHNYR